MVRKNLSLVLVLLCVWKQIYLRFLIIVYGFIHVAISSNHIYIYIYVFYVTFFNKKFLSPILMTAYIMDMFICYMTTLKMPFRYLLMSLKNK